MKTAIRLSPELGDGGSESIVPTKHAALDAVLVWLDEFAEEEGESCTLEIVRMTEEEFNALPVL